MRREHRASVIRCAAGWLTIAAALAAPPPPAATNDWPSLHLESAVAAALAHNRDLLLRARDVTGAELAGDAARAGFAARIAPNSNAGVGQGGSSWQYGLALSKPTVYGTAASVGARYAVEDSTEADSESVDTRAVDFRLTQPLFRNFGRLVNGEPLVQAHQGLRSARRQIEMQRARLVLEVIESYDAIQRLGRQIAIDAAAADRADRLGRLTRARERQGRASRVDSLRVDLQSGSASARLAASRERLDFERRHFAELVGASPSQNYQLAEMPPLDFTPPALPEAIRIALSNRLDYAQAIQDAEDSGRAARIAGRRVYPDLSLLARYSVIEQSGETDSRNPDDWFVGLVAGSAYNPRADRVTLQQARLAESASQDVIDNVALAIAREVQQVLGAYQRASLEVQIEERNVQMAAARATLARRLFEAGKGDSFSASDAGDALSESEIQLLNARSAMAIGGHRIFYTLGRLLQHPEELRPPQAEDRSTHATARVHPTPPAAAPPPPDPNPDGYVPP